MILSQGALNPIVNENRHQKNRILIALGGSSKRHQWNDQKVLQAIQQIIEHNDQAEIVLTTSRRTPKEFFQHLQSQPYLQQIQVFPVEKTPQGWIFEEMQKAEAVWVTEDSVSMIYEALTAGCKEDRITRSVEQMLEQSLISTHVVMNQLPKLLSLQEAQRIADQLYELRS